MKLMMNHQHQCLTSNGVLLVRCRPLLAQTVAAGSGDGILARMTHIGFRNGWGISVSDGLKRRAHAGARWLRPSF